MSEIRICGCESDGVKFWKMKGSNLGRLARAPIRDAETASPGPALEIAAAGAGILDVGNLGRQAVQKREKKERKSHSPFGGSKTRARVGLTDAERVGRRQG